ncbi:MAG: hypothetical protein EOP84_05975, partial [Verrucomicrobiaceae bacterium]
MSETFKDQHPEMQHLARELALLRVHNVQLTDDNVDREALLMAEAAVVCMSLERFLRITLGPQVKAGDTLGALLDKAFSERLQLLQFPGHDVDAIKKRLRLFRNAVLHGDYEAAAANAGCATIHEYFRTKFTPEIEEFYQTVNAMIAQVDQQTGQRG